MPTTPINEVVLADALRMAGCNEEEVRVMLVARAEAGDAERAARAASRLSRDIAAYRRWQTVGGAYPPEDRTSDDVIVVTDFARKFLRP